MTLRLLFTLHAIATIAAAIVLVLAPTAIPRTVGIIIMPSAFLLCYLLAGAELCIGVISWGAREVTDAKALRVVVTGFIVFHGASAMFELWAVTAGLSGRIWANVVFRIVAVALFAYYGIAGRSLRDGPQGCGGVPRLR
jgi:hypothetical protein